MPAGHEGHAHHAAGKDQVTQDLSPVHSHHAHLNAFHAYASDPTGRPPVETNHFCAHYSANVRQCVLYDSMGPNAKLIGVEYMVTDDVFATLPAEERKLWHSHVFEVKSGMLVLPPGGLHGASSTIPAPSAEALAAFEKVETEEMKAVIKLYGKVYHLWQVDRGDKLPLGEPMLMTSYTAEGQMDWEKVKERDRKYGVDSARKKELRKNIPDHVIHPDADQAWKKSK